MAVAWGIVSKWSEQSRYKIWDAISATTLIQAIDDPKHGVFQWKRVIGNSQINESISLITSLDDQGESPVIAIWYYFTDVETWRLLIAGPTFDEKLPKQEPLAYRIIAENINKLKLTSLSISQIMIVRTDYNLFSATNSLIEPDKKI